MLSARVQRLLARARGRRGSFWQRRVWEAEACAGSEGAPSVLRQARILERILEQAPAVVGPEERIVGTQPLSAPPDPQPGGVALLPDIHALRTEEQRRAMRAGVFCSGIKTGHLTPDYAGLLAEGYGGVLHRVEARRQSAAGEATHTLDAMAITLRAASAFVRRHADEARRQAAGQGELLSVAEACERVASEAPRTLQEALQLLWSTFLIQCFENGESTGAFALGRFDQYLYRFWRSDLDAGVQREDLVELVACFWVKLNEFPGLQVLNLTLAGTDAEGRDCCNDLSFACLEVMGAMRTPAPSLSVRWHRGIDPAFFRQAVRLATLGFGQPAFYGDPAARRAMESAGVTRADSAGVVPGGCVELGIEGCCNPWVGNFFSLPKCLELALHNGADPATGEQAGPATGTPGDLGSFDRLLAAYEAQVAHGMALMADSENLCDRIAGEYLPYPFLSALVGDCVERGRDITRGGARYNFTEDQGIGLAHVVDSLLNLRRVAFEGGEMTLEEMVRALDAGFEGNEALRRRLQRMRPAYGDHTEETAALIRRVAHGYFEAVERFGNPRGGPHRPGLLVWTLYHDWADAVGALPDGRRCGEALVSSIGPRTEARIEAPTSVVLDATAFDHWHCAGALTLNLRFDAGSVRGESGLAALEGLLRAYFERGGLQAQVNVVDSALLRQAQADPAAYADLLVRVSGFVARFVDLHPRMQGEIIAREELTA